MRKLTAYYRVKAGEPTIAPSRHSELNAACPEPLEPLFYKVSNAQYVSTAGFAVVVGKYENKAAFIDLQMLFARVREMYFTSEENFQKSRDFSRWPYSFDADPSWKPTVVLASMTGGDKARAFIASKDGTVGIYQVGGLATEAPSSADDIQRVAQVKVGRNPTWLTYQKYRNDTLLAVARGDRQITWVQYAGKVKEPQVIRTLRDERLRDPVYVEVADTHGIETSLLTVADFQGRQIINYRFSPVVFATQGGARFGMGPDGKDAFECGGLMEFPGFPFCVCASNVN